MPRVKLTDRPRAVKIYLKGSTKERLDAALYSELEGRVPFGAPNNLINRLVELWLVHPEILQ